MDRNSPSSQPSATPVVLELVVVAGDAVTVRALPSRGSVTLGRGEECDVRIDAHPVSRKHAVLHMDPPLRIQDLGSANGTFVRDTRSAADTASTQPLRKLSGETIEIAVGERVNLGVIPIVVRRAASARQAPSLKDDIVLRAPEMIAIYERITRIARSMISVLVLGETGVGKEIVARAIHDRSPRAQGPFLELNCAALPHSLLESELFGHEKNAFTGASQARPGLLESADGGTVFLDEVGELPPSTQVKLLRVLEDRKVLRIGGRTSKQLDVRFVAATLRDLQAEVDSGSFREDFYQRLDGDTIMIPPLRERVVEIAPLAERFLAEACQINDRTEPLHLSPESLEYLMRYRWPGNVRELRKVIERAVVLADGQVITPADLSGTVTGAARAPGSKAGGSSKAGSGPEDSGGLKGSGNPNGGGERERIEEALAQCAGNQTRAAKLLGISLRTLVNRLQKYGIPRPRTGPDDPEE